jgi:hypothetical protein
MSWDDAGGIVWHTGDVDPRWLGETMRAEGFGWVAVYLGGPTDPTTPDPSWLERFRAASGLPVGAWSVLGDDPGADAARAVQLIGANGFSFYIADAEQDYGYTDGTTHSSAQYARSRLFVDAFRAAEPNLPAAVSSYCRPDLHDLDWAAWARGGFDFLPQAYTNDLGANGAPAVCLRAAARWFAKSRVHPTVASYAGMYGFVPPARSVADLRAAGTTGFSIYPAEVNMSAQDWQVYGTAITALRIARRPG